MQMTLERNGFGPIEIVRPDGWRYPLHGLRLGEWCMWSEDLSIDVTLEDLSDRTLDSLRTLRDALPGVRLEVSN